MASGMAGRGEKSEIVHQLYSQLLQVIDHRLGVITIDSNDLLRYIQRVFDFSDDEHNRCQIEASKEPGPTDVLLVQIMELKGVMSGDKVCPHLTCVPEMESSGRITKMNERNLGKCLGEEMLFKPADWVYSNFKLSLYHRFHKNDGECGLPLDRRNLKKDKFMGHVDYTLKETPELGLDEWFALVGGVGNIRLIFKLSGERRTDTELHEQIYSSFVDYEIEKHRSSSIKWDNTLPNEAESILHQHCIQSNLSEQRKSMCMWMAYCKHPVQYYFLRDLLDAMELAWRPNSLSLVEEDRLFTSFNHFLEACYLKLRHIRHEFNDEDWGDRGQLAGMLRCMLALYELTAFQACNRTHLDLVNDITAALQMGNMDWYDKEITNELKLEVSVELVEYQLFIAERSYDALFRRVDLQYSTMMRHQFSRLFTERYGKQYGRLVKSKQRKSGFLSCLFCNC